MRHGSSKPVIPKVSTPPPFLVPTRHRLADQLKWRWIGMTSRLATSPPGARRVRHVEFERDECAGLTPEDLICEERVKIKTQK